MRKSDLVLPDYPINKGDRGLNVARLQACFDYIYKHKGNKKLQSLEPSYMGSYTYIDLLAFQEENKIRKTGIYDKLTRQKLREVIQ